MSFRRIDIHAHLNFSAYNADREEVINRALEGGTAFINVGTDNVTSRESVELANKYEKGVYAIVGRHPADNVDEIFDPAKYRELLKHPKVVGIGECGLDYFHILPGGAEKQKNTFIAQIELANEFSKPLMLHVRDAYDDALAILKSHANVVGDVHFFAGTIEQARAFLDIGYTLSFTGVITFAKQYEELVEFVPLDMIQAETDCPFVAPAPYRGKRNEPSYVSEVVSKISQIKKLPVDNIEKALLINAKRMFGIDL
ncbi:MAG: TatD family hydrolase [Candidatus Taylorbacteria bacterium]|nr:TatD family hydrolase [Candidatus Taylorbacteria bacterium]